MTFESGQILPVEDYKVVIEVFDGLMNKYPHLGPYILLA